MDEGVLAAANRLGNRLDIFPRFPLKREGASWPKIFPQSFTVLMSFTGVKQQDGGQALNLPTSPAGVNLRMIALIGLSVQNE